MAINIDADLLNDTSKELLSLLNDKDYKASVRLINKEIRYLNDQIKRNEKLKKSIDNIDNDIILSYSFDRDKKALKKELKILKDFRDLVHKAEKKPKAVRLNAGIQRFNIVSQKSEVRKANIKKSRSTKKYHSQKTLEYIEVFYTRGYLENPKFQYFVLMEEELNQFLEKYFGKNFSEELKKKLKNVSPYNMTNGVEEELSVLGYHFISKIDEIEIKTEEQEKEVEMARFILSKILKG